MHPTDGNTYAINKHLDEREAYDRQKELLDAEKERNELAELIEECDEYLKPGETPRQRMDRDHADVLSLMNALHREKLKTEAAEAKMGKAVERLESIEYDVTGGDCECSICETFRTAIIELKG